MATQHPAAIRTPTIVAAAINQLRGLFSKPAPYRAVVVPLRSTDPVALRPIEMFLLTRVERVASTTGSATVAHMFPGASSRQAEKTHREWIANVRRLGLIATSTDSAGAPCVAITPRGQASLAAAREWMSSNGGGQIIGMTIGGWDQVPPGFSRWASEDYAFLSAWLAKERAELLGALAGALDAFHPAPGVGPGPSWMAKVTDDEMRRWRTVLDEARGPVADDG